MFVKKNIGVLIVLSLCTSALQAHDIWVEGKGAYFLPTQSSAFKHIYHGGGIFGVEATAKWYKPDHWIYRPCNWIMENMYGFASVDVFSKKGKTVTFETRTRATIVNLALGLKYVVPFCYGNAYVGLGVLPMYLQTVDDSPYVIHRRSNWGCGGIAKAGVIFDESEDFFVDIFCNYSFGKVNFKQGSDALTVSRNADVSGCWFGAGIGHKFK
jgi:hypothetical protein